MLGLALSAYPVARADRLVPVVGGVGAFAVLVLALALAARAPELLAWALFLLGVEYAVSLTLGGEAIDGFAPIFGAGLFLLAQLGAWALEAGIVASERPLVVRRLAAFGVSGLVAGGVGAVVVASSELALRGGVLLQAVGVGAAVCGLGLVAALAWRRMQRADPFA